jgi:hypothetical protein
MTQLSVLLVYAWKALLNVPLALLSAAPHPNSLAQTLALLLTLTLFLLDLETMMRFHLVENWALVEELQQLEIPKSLIVTSLEEMFETHEPAKTQYSLSAVTTYSWSNIMEKESIQRD